MHFEILVEGQGELTTLSILMEKILGPYRQPHTWKIHKHRGIGSLPEDPSLPPSRGNQTLLHNLPARLRAYGRDLGEGEVVVVLVDLDDRDCGTFKQELVGLLTHCNPKPRGLFRIAIEELEAWFFGDQAAIWQAYPDANMGILDSYVQDSKCGTWEMLADAIHPGGLAALHVSYGKRSVRVSEHKVVWAKRIAPHMDVENNQSQSFQYFRDGLRKLANPVGR
jgi:hypothetical protein